MILAAAIASILFALYYPQPGRVARYLYAQLVGTLIYFGVNHFWGDTSLIYGIAYTVTTAVILACVIAIVIGTIGLRQNSYRGAAIAALVPWAMVLLCLFHPGERGPYDLVTITEGAILLWSGIVMGCLAPYMENRWLALVLAGFWLGQAAFRIFFYATAGDAYWHGVLQRHNWHIEPILGITAFFMIGWLGRRVSLVASYGRERGVPGLGGAP